MTHELKLKEEFASAVLTGGKRFEIRLNDRGYQKGDYVHFIVVGKAGEKLDHPLSRRTFEITYVLNGWGLKNGYVAFSIKELTR